MLDSLKVAQRKISGLTDVRLTGQMPFLSPNKHSQSMKRLNANCCISFSLETVTTALNR